MSSAAIYYRFSSSRKDAQSKITFDGTGISLWDLKREVILQNKMGKGHDFDIGVYATKEAGGEGELDRRVEAQDGRNRDGKAAALFAAMIELAAKEIGVDLCLLISLKDHHERSFEERKQRRNAQLSDLKIGSIELPQASEPIFNPKLEIQIRIYAMKI